MELRQLGYFLAVAREESFTRAAERMHVAQPGISQQIRRLEADLGDQLFDRSHKNVRLSAAGQAFLPHAQAALAATDAGRAAIAELHGLVRGQLRIGTIPGIPFIDLAGLLATFYGKHPGVEVTLKEEQPGQLIDGLNRDDYDIAIVGLSNPHPPDGLTIDLLGIEALVLIVATDHRPLGHRTRVAMNRLRDEPFVTLTRGTALRGHLEDACAQAGFPARIAVETDDVQLLSELVARGLGVSIVPRSIAEAGAAHHRLRIIDVRPSITQRCTALAWRTTPSPSPATREFLAHCRAVLSSADGGTA